MKHQREMQIKVQRWDSDLVSRIAFSFRKDTFRYLSNLYDGVRDRLGVHGFLGTGMVTEVSRYLCRAGELVKHHVTLLSNDDTEI